MSIISAAFSAISPLNTSSLKITKLSPEQIAAHEQLIRDSYRTPVISNPDTVYATVKVNGKVVATLYNSGASVTSNSDHTKLKNLPSMGDTETATGPELAQKRAEEIAKALGGTIEKASTAQTAEQWTPAQVEWVYDEAAIERAFAARSASAQTQFLAQLLGQETTSDQ